MLVSVQSNSPLPHQSDTQGGDFPTTGAGLILEVNADSSLSINNPFGYSGIFIVSNRKITMKET